MASVLAEDYSMYAGELPRKLKLLTINYLFDSRYLFVSCRVSLLFHAAAADWWSADDVTSRQSRFSHSTKAHRSTTEVLFVSFFGILNNIFRLTKLL